MLMKTPILKALLATTLVLGFSLSAYAEMVSEEVEDDTITPEQQEQVVLVPKKKVTKLPVVKKKVVYQAAMEEEPMQEPAPAAQYSNSNQAIAIATAQPAPAPAPRKGVGSVMDEAVDNKMSDVRNQFEQAIVKSLDRIKVSVDDGGSAAAAAPQTTTVVQDGLTETASAPLAAPADAYLSIDKAPKISDAEEESDDELADGASVARADEKKSLSGSVRLTPLGGFTSLKSDNYNIDSRYTAGIGIEVDIDSNLSAVASYTYSQYDVSLANGTSFYNYYSPILNGGNTNKLEYNQNLFDAGLRFYLLPRESRFRAFIGTGLGYNKGYLNYKTSQAYGYTGYTSYGNLEDYEVTSFVGQLETGAEIQLSKLVAFGGLFKYSKILSSRENRPINNYGFVNNGYGYQAQDDKSLVGGSISQNDFYSILGTVKVSF